MQTSTVNTNANDDRENNPFKALTFQNNNKNNNNNIYKKKQNKVRKEQHNIQTTTKAKKTKKIYCLKMTI